MGKRGSGMSKKGDRPRANPAKQPVAVVEAKQLNTQRDNEQVSETGGDGITHVPLPSPEGGCVIVLIDLTFLPSHLLRDVFTKGGLVLEKKITRQHTLNRLRNLVWQAACSDKSTHPHYGLVFTDTVLPSDQNMHTCLLGVAGQS